MKRPAFLRLAVCLVALASPLGIAFAQSGDSTLVAQSAMPLSVTAGNYTLVSVVLDFAPGAGISEHTHGGALLVTVLQGQATLREEGGSQTYKPGEGWMEMPGHKHSAINDGAADDRVALVALLPKGAELTTLTPEGAKSPLPPPTVVSQAAFPLTLPAEDASLVSVILDFPPGTGIPLHVHGGPVLAQVLEGAMTLHDQGTATTYKQGEMWTEVPGHAHSAANEGSGNARVLVASLLPKGEDLQTLVNSSPAGMPSTGAGPLLPPWWPVPMIALALGLLLRAWPARKERSSSGGTDR
jgi:quercetin dioxygenase-like cupin family protein